MPRDYITRVTIRVSAKEPIRMRVNRTRERLAKGETVLGCAIESYRSPEVARTFAEIIDHQNRNILAVVQFETTTAMERADELLSVKGMDIAMGCPADLSISLGIPGQMDHPLLISTVERLIENAANTA